jgi:PKD repeat protein
MQNVNGGIKMKTWIIITALASMCLFGTTILVSALPTTECDTDIFANSLSMYGNNVDRSATVTKSSSITITSAPIDPQKNVSLGFWPANTDPTTYQPNWAALTHVANLDWNINADGTLADKNSDTNKRANIIFTNAKKNEVKTLIGAGTGSADNIDNILANYTDDFANNIVAKINSTGTEGIILDFEYPRTVNSITGTSNVPLFENMMKKVYNKVKSVNSSYTVMLCTPPYFTNEMVCYKNNNLSNYVDSVFIMGYNYFWNGPTGANSPFYNDSTRYGLKFAVAEQSSYYGKNKLIYGVPFYGYEYITASNRVGTSISSANQVLLRSINPQAYGSQWDFDSNTPYYYYLNKSSGKNKQKIMNSCDRLGSTDYDYHISRTVGTTNKTEGSGAYKCVATSNGTTYMLLRNNSRWNISSANYVCANILAPVEKTMVLRLFSAEDSEYVNYRFSGTGNWQQIIVPFKQLTPNGNFNSSSVYDIRIDMIGSEIGDIFYVDNITSDTYVNTWHQFWYDDNKSLALKYQYIKDQGLQGVGFWALGYEGNNSSIWNVFSRQSDKQSSQQPVTSFTGSPTSGNVPLTVQFNDTSTNVPTSWLWDFGDGSANSTSQNPPHIYATDGVYTVTLTTINAAGRNAVTRSNYITVSLPRYPTANFSANVTSGIKPLSVKFTDSSQNATGRYWDFNNDGTNDSTAQNPTYIYNSAGVYSVKLTAVNTNGSSAKLNSNYIIASIPPIASFNATPLSGLIPLSVQFTDSSTGYPIAWNWSFGDGTSSVQQSPIHTYSAAGNYSVILTVRNANGTNSEIAKITVLAKPMFPVANFNTNLTSGYVPLSVQFTYLSKNATSNEWNFGDGTSSTLKNPEHTYSKTGKYIVNLTAINGNGTDSKLTTINVLKATGSHGYKNMSFGFWPANTDPNSYQPNWAALTHVANLDWNINTDGTLVDKNADTNKHANIIFTAAKSNGIKTLIGAGSGCPDDIDNILVYHADDLADSISSKINSMGTEGIILDFEYPRTINSITGTSNTPLFENMMKKVYNKVKSVNSSYTVMLCTPPYFTNEINAYRNGNLSNYVDSFFIMGYDYYWNGPTGSNCPLFNDSTRYGIRQGIVEQSSYYGKDKLIFGLPIYGYEYVARSKQPGASVTYANQIMLKYIIPQTYGRNWDFDSNTPYYYYLNDSSGANTQNVLNNCDNLGSTTYDYHVTRTVDTNKTEGTGSLKCVAMSTGNVYMLLRNASRWDISSANYISSDVKAPAGKSMILRLFSSEDANYVSYEFTGTGNWQHISVPFKEITPTGFFNSRSVYDIRFDMTGSTIGDTYYVDNLTTDTYLSTYNQIWYEDNESLAIKYKYIRDQGLQGVGFWALGYEGNNSSIWNVFAR